jgi:hypothetical protein
VIQPFLDSQERRSNDFFHPERDNKLDSGSNASTVVFAQAPIAVEMPMDPKGYSMLGSLEYP